MSGVVYDPRVARVVDLLTTALIAAAEDATTTQRFIHSDIGVDRVAMVKAQEASRVAQVAVQNAIYELAESLLADEQVAS